jgi:hypothetical protein
MDVVLSTDDGDLSLMKNPLWSNLSTLRTEQSAPNRPPHDSASYAESTTKRLVIHAEKATDSYIQSDKHLLIGWELHPTANDLTKNKHAPRA